MISGGIAANVGVRTGDVIRGIIVNGVEKQITRTFMLDDVALTIRAGDTVSLVLERDGDSVTTSVYNVAADDLGTLS